MKQQKDFLKIEHGRYQHIFDLAPVGIWEVDISASISALKKLQKDGITDIEKYLEEDDSRVQKLSSLIRIIN